MGINRKPKEAGHDIVLGVDPGGNGALALYRPNAAPIPGPPGTDIMITPHKLMVWDMPTRKVQTTKNKFKVELDLRALSDLAKMLVDSYGVQRVVIEKVGGMPGQGSGFTFGWNCGVVHMAFVAHGLVPELVSPGQWKKDAQVPADKKQAVACADATFEEHRDLFRVPHATQKGKFVVRSDRAEAALIAWWGVNC
jgi:hypothetical protein